jgi:hypothetical protein
VCLSEFIVKALLLTVLVSRTIMCTLFDYLFPLLLQDVRNTSMLLNHVVIEINIQGLYIIYDCILNHRFLQTWHEEFVLSV